MEKSCNPWDCNTHTHTHTHTQVIVRRLIARNSKTFGIPKNIRKLDYDCTPLAIIL